MNDEDTEYDADEIEREYELCTPKQKACIDVAVEDDYATKSDAAKEAGVSPTYFNTVATEHSDIIEYRKTAMRYATDGSGQSEFVDVRFTDDEAFKAIRILPAELSQVVYQAVQKENQQ